MFFHSIHGYIYIEFDFMVESTILNTNGSEDSKQKWLGGQLVALESD